MNAILSLLLLSGLAHCAPVNPCVGGFVVPGSMYDYVYILQSSYKNYSSAVDYCSSSVFPLSNLPVLRDAVTYTALANRAKISSWVGLSKDSPSAPWIWADGVPASVRVPKWEPSSPNYLFNRTCANLNDNGLQVTNLYHDCPSNLKFFCEFECTHSLLRFY
jgi:hypothetical protein